MKYLFLILNLVVFSFGYSNTLIKAGNNEQIPNFISKDLKNEINVIDYQLISIDTNNLNDKSIEIELSKNYKFNAFIRKVERKNNYTLSIFAKGYDNSTDIILTITNKAVYGIISNHLFVYSIKSYNNLILMVRYNQPNMLQNECGFSVKKKYQFIIPVEVDFNKFVNQIY